MIFKKILIAAVIVLVLALLIAMYCICAKMYKSNFNSRYTTKASDYFNVKRFSGLERERFTFESDKSQKLAGYLYENINTSKKGVVVFAHGLGGGGHTGYMDLFDLIARKGYYIFAYDATANDESEGDAVGGLPQGIIDLDYAISYVKTIDKIRGLPISLMGYSWGGLSVANVLNYHDDIASVISLAGWNRSVNLVEDRAEKIIGRASKIMVPFVSLYEFANYGKYAFSSGVKGFENTKCNVMIIHSEDDSVVPIKYGYDTYFKIYGNDSRFLFKRLKNRGHDVYKNPDGTLDTQLIDEMILFLDRAVSTTDLG